MDEMNTDNIIAPTEPMNKYSGKTKNRYVAAVLVFLFGPLGFLYFGMGAAFTAFCIYTALIVFTGGAAAPFLMVLIPIGTAIITEEGVKSLEYRQYEAALQKYHAAVAKAERTKAEGEYYGKLGTSKLQATLFGDPNAKKSLMNMVDAVKNGDLKGALHGLHGSLDPVGASKAEEVRTELKVVQAQKAVSNACCSSCQTQNEVGTKFCRECGESMMKAA